MRRRLADRHQKAPRSGVTTQIHRSLSTVSIDPDTGLLFVGDFSGFVHCLDAETGKLYWTHDNEGAYLGFHTRGGWQGVPWGMRTVIWW